jgi:hypothetical protein
MRFLQHFRFQTIMKTGKKVSCVTNNVAFMVFRFNKFSEKP